jgi:hypothetical protein
MKNKLYFLASLLIASGAFASTLLNETFKDLTIGDLNGQNGWIVNSGTADVQDSEFFSDSIALEIKNGEVSHALSSNGTAIWLNFRARISATPETNPAVSNTNTSAAFFVNTNLYLVVYEGTNEVVTGQQVPLNEWVQFDIYCDYNESTWSLYMNSNNVAADLNLYDPVNRQIESVLLANNSSNSVYIDDILISDEELLSAVTLDKDTDGLPDWWEQKYYGGITNASPDGTAANGMTRRQAYIAGLDPKDAAARFRAAKLSGQQRGLSWNARPGRTYIIEYAPDLISEFKPIQTNDWPASEFVHNDNTDPSGFYRLRAEMLQQDP